MQLYTVREALQADLPGTLARLAELGFTQVEAFNIVGLEGLGDGLAAAGLRSPTAHQRFVGETQEAIFEKAAALGIRTLIDPHIDEERWQTADGVKAIVADLAAAAEKAQTFGLAIGYHNHAFEFETKIDGRPAYELFAAQLPGSVSLELDTYWAAVGGTDPVELLGELGSKVIALHVKDGPATHENKDQVAVGSGSLPIRSIIEAAPTALRVIELDDSRGDRFQAVADSVAFLKSEGLA
ncbi:sugar phosphate isomerase/epimerase [Gryllotalpicola protaetiae]|uniref:Sugar phosphate isomerase/epimerase n=1 Tax=Gryllotalpicola protaetiae TaxID=2419771 RepID=A0A387BMF5_9MICO|nr:sugar phosphate isomerase/epimerase [Gryllotalpicola protaetiae]